MNKRVTDEEFNRIYWKIDERCSLIVDPVMPVHLTHEHDSKKFYVCYMGRAYLMDCPRGSEWSPRLDNCVEIKQISTAKDPQCPAVDDPFNPVHYPHPFECNLFYKCSNGVGVLFECPPGLHWSTATDRCERPEDANCVVK